MELSLSHTLRLFNIFCEFDGNENCAQVLEEEVYKMFGTRSLYDENDCNVVSMNSRLCFLAFQYRLRSLLPLATLLFLYFQITKTYIYHPYCTCITISSPN